MSGERLDPTGMRGRGAEAAQLTRPASTIMASPIAAARLALAMLLVLCGASLAKAQEEHDAPDYSFRHQLGALVDESAGLFAYGHDLFLTDWAVAPGPTPWRDGIGPMFDALGCDGCHFHAGRGRPPHGHDEPMTGMVVMLSVSGGVPGGAPLSHPVYGRQLHHNALEGVPVQGKVFMDFTEEEGHYADGSVYRLRRPHYRFAELGYGPLGDGILYSIFYSVRVAPQLVGMGLLAAVPEATIAAIAAEEARLGQVHGRINQVAVAQTTQRAPGRFGWKAGQPSLLQQNANAFNIDIGITNPLFPENDCTEAETACRTIALASERKPKVIDREINGITFYVSHLAPPPPRGEGDMRLPRGAALFMQAGCAACHRPTLATGDDPDPDLAHRTLHPYTDLLLHDMGDGLADGRSEFAASGSDWRTPPLWGIGLLRVVSGHEFLLHDGRARGPAEAILWHGGEAESAKEAFRHMSAEDRAALIAFLEAL